MRNRRLYVYLTVYLLLGTAAVMSVQGQPPTGEPTVANDTLDVVVSRGKPKAISDWALAGVVWSDACLLRKLALASAAASDDESVQARYVTLADRADELISSLEGFGWKRIARRSNKESATPSNDVASGSPERILATNDSSLAPADNTARRVARALPVPSQVPVELNVDQQNFRLEGAGYAEPEFLPPQVEKGLEEAIANKGLRSVEFAERTGRISYRESQTRSGSMPYSRQSIYDTDDYDPVVDYRAENPLATLRPDRVAGIERLTREEAVHTGEHLADMYGFDDPVATDRENGEFDGGQIKPSQLLDRLSGTAVVEKFTPDSGRYKQDADWVQLHLNMNQMLWLRVAGGPEIAPATQLAQLKLANSANLASSSTNNARLREILSVVAD